MNRTYTVICLVAAAVMLIAYVISWFWGPPDHFMLFAALVLVFLAIIVRSKTP